MLILTIIYCFSSLVYSQTQDDTSLVRKVDHDLNLISNSSNQVPIQNNECAKDDLASTSSENLKDIESKRIVLPFKTDKCTGWLNGTKKYDWSQCCIMHDLQMWAGGTKEHRNIADKELKACLKEASNSFHANIIYLGVSAGKLFPIKLKDKKWGHAWPKEYQREKLTAEDINKIKSNLLKTQTLDVSDEMKNQFIQKLILLNQGS